MGKSIDKALDHSKPLYYDNVDNLSSRPATSGKRTVPAWGVGVVWTASATAGLVVCCPKLIATTTTYQSKTENSIAGALTSVSPKLLTHKKISVYKTTACFSSES